MMEWYLVFAVALLAFAVRGRDPLLCPSWGAVMNPLPLSKDIVAPLSKQRSGDATVVLTTYISINRQIIARNAKYGLNVPPIRISHGKYGKPRYAREIEISGPSRIIYDANKSVLPSGARLALATESPVKVLR